MAVLAKLYNTGREAERHVVEAGATLRGEDQVPSDILVANISSTGCLFVCTKALDLGSHITIGIPHLGILNARVIRVLDQDYGCEFINPLSDAEVAAASNASDTVALFPFWTFRTTTSLDNLPALDKLPVPARLLIISGAASVIWLGIFFTFYTSRLMDIVKSITIM